MDKLINFGMVATQECKEIVSIIDTLKNTSSTKAKLAILEENKNNEGLRDILELTYNPFKKYKITQKSLKGGNGRPCRSLNLQSLTKTLMNNTIDNELRLEVNNFLGEVDTELVDLYTGVLLKDLKIGVNKSTLNKVWDNLIPSSVDGTNIGFMLAEKYDFEKPLKEDIVVTEKLDGIRCCALVENNTVRFYTKEGNRIHGCVEVEQAILEMVQADIINCKGEHIKYDRVMLDGELLAIGCGYDTVYKETIKRVNNKKLVKTGVQYKMFDIMPLNDYLAQKCDLKYYERREMLHQFSDYCLRSDFVDVVPALYIGIDESRVLELLDIYRVMGAEGLMANIANAPYEFKRTNSILKLKVMQTADLKIIGFNKGKPNGKFKDTLGSIIVDYKGFEVSANIKGENNMAIREEIWNNQDKYLGKIAEISYFEETHDKEGNLSLRFPVFKWIREDKTEPSYY